MSGQLEAPRFLIYRAGLTALSLRGAGPSPGGRHRGRCAPAVGRGAQAGTTRTWSPTRCARVAQARDTPSALALAPHGKPSAVRSASGLRCAG